ncbi:MAG TPA: sensor histidine kinase [Chloroflexota bacterium]|nr:sensor histidine kinase [Chloroflexota bacterium]
MTASTDPGTRVAGLTNGANFAWVAMLLAEQRSSILARWLEAAAAQPFHVTNTARAVADDIPRLFDALIVHLQSYGDPEDRAGSEAPLRDAAIRDAAHAHALARLEQALAPQEIVTEFRLLRQEIGRAIRLHLPDTAPSNDVGGAVLVVHDALDGAIFLALTTITQRETEREALASVRLALEAERERFVAGLAHDLNNPLARIKGTVQLLQRRIARGALGLSDVSGALDGVNSAVGDMTAQLSEFVDGMRLREGASLALHRTHVELTALVREVAALHQDGTDQHQIRVEAPDSSPIVGAWDRARLTRVLDNLFRNAIKYSPRGGPITASVRRESRAGRMLGTVAIADTGIGVPVADLPFVFDPFRRGANVARGIPGSGIGLFAVRQIVEQHGGAVEVQSQEGHGSTFAISLPLSEADAAPL